MIKKVLGFFVGAFCIVSSVFLFQNCGRGFQTLGDSASLGSNSIPLSNFRENQVASVSSEQNCDPSAGWICMDQPLLAKDTLIGAWYAIYFYTRGASPIDHWAETRYRPELGYYESGDVMAQQYPYLKRAGIDYLLLDHTNGWGNDLGRITENAKKVFANLPSDMPVAIANGAPLWNSTGSREQRGKDMQVEADLIFNELMQKPNYLKWYDPATSSYKPLLVVYNDIQNEHPGDEIHRYWKDPRMTVRYSAGYANSSNPLLAPYANEGIWGWVIHSPQIVSPETMAVQAGHNTTHLKNRVAPPIYRENGALYMRQWLYILKSRPRNVIIPSWNDWAEETSIEPARRVDPTAEAIVDYYGEETPDWYLQITEGYTNLRKGLMPGNFYKTENDNTVYKVEGGKLVAQGAMPRRKPVIILPAGSLDKYKTAAPTTPAPQTPVTTPPVVTPAPVVTPTNPQTPVVTAPPVAAPIPEGLFKIGVNIYYSNGANYCYFPNMAHFTARTGRTNADGIRLVTSIPASMRNDGNCQ